MKTNLTFYDGLGNKLGFFFFYYDFSPEDIVCSVDFIDNKKYVCLYYHKRYWLINSKAYTFIKNSYKRKCRKCL